MHPNGLRPTRFRRFCQNVAMHHFNTDTTEALPEDIRRTENSLADISARIARLAMAIDAPVATLNDIEAIMNKEVPLLAHHAYQATATLGGSDQGRLTHQWEELRGLLLLRCDLVSQLIKSHDLHTATTVLTDIEAQLEREGFQHRALAFNLVRYLSQNSQADGSMDENTPLPKPLV